MPNFQLSDDEPASLAAYLTAFSEGKGTELGYEFPAGVPPGSKMPRYADGNESQRTDILEGDAHKQCEAIWHWLHSQ